ncbi:MAG: molybdenum cofactor biosynthesis protein MoaE [Ignavibacteriales bacterium]|nr:molybdenum cofactor biosynthesis protein MoaE [Ignavibacteriales bacterium]
MVQLTKNRIETEEVLRSVIAPESGAVNVFVGTTRNHSNGRRVTSLEYEAYEPMAVKMMERVVREAQGRWDVSRISVVHRIGKVNIGESSVVIAVSSPHRDEAFQACRFLIDRLKQVVPIWKREFFEDGSSEWSLQSHEQETATQAG